MSDSALLPTLLLCLALAGTETLHGIARTVLVVPKLGKERALKLSIYSGSALALIVCWFWVPGVGLHGALPHLSLGFVLAAFMASFDLALGLLLLRRTWRKALTDFQPSTGNRLVYGLAALSLMPLGVAALRGLL